jgi:hypothetical protein
LLACCSNQAKAIAKECAAELRLTAEFPRSYRCVVQRRGNWTMDDHIVFWDTFFPYIFLR